MINLVVGIISISIALLVSHSAVIVYDNSPAFAFGVLATLFAVNGAFTLIMYFTRDYEQ